MDDGISQSLDITERMYYIFESKLKKFVAFENS